MHTVTTLDIFKKEVVKIARQKNAMLFHCYIQGDIFKIATAKKVQQFDFKDIKMRSRFAGTLIPPSRFYGSICRSKYCYFQKLNSKEIPL